MLREGKDYYNNLMGELEENGWEGFYRLMKMYPNFFHYLGCGLTRRNQKETTWRKALPVGLKLGLTLQYLATGIDFSEMHNAR